MVTILVTSVGSLVGENLLDSLQGRRSGVRVVATTSVAAVPLDRCDKVHLVPETEQTGHEE